MPVIGHAFVGLATARQFRPERRTLPPTSAEVASWTSLIIVLAYLPDIITQVGSSAGWTRAGIAGHSVFVGSILGIICCTVWALLVRAPRLRTIVIGVSTILLHDAFDILQATDRAPFWPLSWRVVTAGTIAIPNRLVGEFVLFGGSYLGYLVWRNYMDSQGSAITVVSPTPSRSVLWLSRAIVASLMIGAILTYLARGYRERQLNAAEHLIRRGDYTLALSMLDVADSWPRFSKPGRIDMLRGEAREGLGDVDHAEAFYLRAYESDPTNFWVVADLAEFYASSRRPPADRRRIVRPYLDELQRSFRGERDLPQVLGQIERKLDAND